MNRPNRLQASDYAGFLMVAITMFAVASRLARHPNSLVLWIVFGPFLVVGGLIMFRRWRLIRTGTPRV